VLIWASSPYRGRSLPVFRLGHEVLFWTFLADVALLTWVGAQPILPSTGPWLVGARVGVFVLFMLVLLMSGYLLVGMPLFAAYGLWAFARVVHGRMLH